LPREQAFVAIPKEKILEAIGVVVVKWSALEFLLNNTLYWAIDPNNEDEQKTLTTGETSRRWHLLKQLLQRRYGVVPGALEMAELVTEAMTLKTKRDNVVHGVYGGDDANPESVFAILIKNSKYRHERRYDRSTLMKIAADVDVLAGKIFMLQAESAMARSRNFGRTPWRHPDRKDD